MIDLNQPLAGIASELIKMPSPTGNEAILSQAIKNTLADFGLSPSAEDGDTLLYHVKGLSDQSIGILGHLDTVPAVSKKQLVPVILDGKLYGRGAVDMKSSIAIMLKALFHFSRSSQKPQHSLLFVFYTGEEGPLPNGLSKLLANNFLPKISLAFVLEPTNGVYQTGCLGLLTGTITVLGKASHSAHPWYGDNAIYKALVVAERIQTWSDQTVTLDEATLVETINITGINTNNASNVIPDCCTIQFSYRFSPEKTIAEAKNELMLKLGVESIVYADESPSAYLSRKTIAPFLDQQIPNSLFQGWSDIAQLQQAGIPALNFGPGSLDVAHTDDEYIEVAELDKFYETLIAHLSRNHAT